MKKLTRLRNIVLGLAIVITLGLGALAVIIGIVSYGIEDKNEFKIQRECTVLEPRVDCLNHCTHGIVGDEQCIMYCVAIVRVHPDDDVGFCIDDNPTTGTCSHKLEQPRNRTTTEFSENSAFYEYQPNTNVTCFLDVKLDEGIASYDMHSPLRYTLYVISITLALMSGLFLVVFIIGLCSVFIHGLLPKKYQLNVHHHHHHHGDHHIRLEETAEGMVD